MHKLALSTSRSKRGGYDRLLDETITDCSASSDPDHVLLKRATSVPAHMLFGSTSKKPNPEPSNSSKSKKKGTGKIHPVFSLFEGRWKKKKMTANPDFSRYLEYLKEGGVWNKGTDSPVIYYK